MNISFEKKNMLKLFLKKIKGKENSSICEFDLKKT